MGNPHICYLTNNGDLIYATYNGNEAVGNEFNWTIPGVVIGVAVIAAVALVTLRFVKNKNKQTTTPL
jgi:heme/copper-type cytochrome/quinol oxidase subunit 2